MHVLLHREPKEPQQAQRRAPRPNGHHNPKLHCTAVHGQRSDAAWQEGLVLKRSAIFLPLILSFRGVECAQTCWAREALKGATRATPCRAQQPKKSCNSSRSCRTKGEPRVQSTHKGLHRPPLRLVGLPSDPPHPSARRVSFTLGSWPTEGGPVTKSSSSELCTARKQQESDRQTDQATGQTNPKQATSHQVQSGLPRSTALNK